MIARMQRFTTLLAWGSAMAWLLVWWPERPVLALVGSGLLALGYAVFLALEMAMLVHMNRPPRCPSGLRPRWGQLLRAWGGEVLACGVVFCWRQPFFSRRAPDGVDAAQIDQRLRGVVLIHGFVCNRGLWLRWQQGFKAQRRAHIALNLEPVFGSIDDYAPLIEAAVQRLTELTGRAPVLVCHSMGGLAARAWLRGASPAGMQDHRVHRVLTLGTPHHGAWVGQFSHMTNGRQMRLDSPWIQALAAAEPPTRGRRFVCWYSHCDNIVFPVLTATLPGAALHHIEGVGHVAMVDDGRVVAGVQAVLDAADDPEA